MGGQVVVAVIAVEENAEKDGAECRFSKAWLVVEQSRECGAIPFMENPVFMGEVTEWIVLCVVRTNRMLR